MAKTKTAPTPVSVESYLAERAAPAQLADCHALIALCERVTGAPPVMWGPSIVGFGSYHYRYDSGHSGDACLTGFAVRGKELVVYVYMDDPAQEALLETLGKFRRTKVCLYIKRLGDVNVDVLGQLIANSVADLRRRYPASAER
jgi:hypothetical protein